MFEHKKYILRSAISSLNWCGIGVMTQMPSTTMQSKEAEGGGRGVQEYKSTRGQDRKNRYSSKSGRTRMLKEKVHKLYLDQ